MATALFVKLLGEIGRGALTVMTLATRGTLIPVSLLWITAAWRKMQGALTLEGWQSVT
jgi:hypothetical protein